MNKTGLFFLAVVFIFGGAFSSKVQAAALTVNNTGDTNDVNPGDGICADASGNCTLRSAVQEANLLSGADSITFSLSSAAAISLTLGEIAIVNELTVSGGGNTTINANSASRIFNIQRSGINVTLRGLTIINGRAGAEQLGGCIYAPQANLTIENSFVRGCLSEASGGGIAASYGTFRLINSTLENNVAGGVGSGGGGATIGGNGSEIVNSRIISNSATRAGGGIEFLGGTLSVTNTTIADNQATGGGGLLVSFGSARISNSTVSGNSATRSGGGIALPYGTVILTNSTVSGNTVSGGEGGGISTGTNGSNGYLTVRNSTVAFNSAMYAGGLTGSGGNNTTVVGNSIVAENTAPNAPNIGAIFNSLGGNLVSNRAGSSGYIATDLPDGTNPLLGSLANNGGATLTHALLAGSPAIDTGLNGNAVDADGAPLTTDQRGSGFPRIVGAAVDIGAYEASGASQTSVSVTGRVTDGKRGIFGARVTLVETVSGTTYAVQTNSAGFYNIENVAAGATYTLTAYHKRASFDPQTTIVNESNNVFNFDASAFVR